MVISCRFGQLISNGNLLCCGILLNVKLITARSRLKFNSRFQSCFVFLLETWAPEKAVVTKEILPVKNTSKAARESKLYLLFYLYLYYNSFRYPQNFISLGLLFWRIIWTGCSSWCEWRSELCTVLEFWYVVVYFCVNIGNVPSSWIKPFVFCLVDELWQRLLTASTARGMQRN